MKKINRRIGGKMYKSLFFSYIFIFMIFMIVFVGYGLFVVNRNSIKSNNEILISFKKYISDNDKKTREIFYNAEQLCESTAFLAIKDMSLTKKEEMYDAYNLIREIKNHIKPYSYSDEIFMCFEEKNQIVGSESIYDKNEFYENILKVDGISGSELSELVNGDNEIIKTLPICEVTINKYEKKEMAIVIINLKDKKCKMIFLLPAGELEHNFEGNVAIFDSDGTVIKPLGSNISEQSNNLVYDSSVKRKKIDFNGEKLFLYYSKAQFFDWKYNLVINSSYANMVAFSMLKMLGLLCLCSIIIEIFLALYFTRINMNPIYSIVLKVMPKWRKEGNEIDIIDDAISKLLENNRKLNSMVNSTSTEIKKAFFEKLLFGKFDSEKQVEQYMSDYDININGSQYLTFSLYFNSDYTHYMEADIVSDLIENVLVEIDDNLVAIGTPKNEIAVIFISEDSIGMDKQRCIAGKILNKTSELVRSQVCVGIGRCSNNLNGIYYSYADARIVTNYMRVSSQVGVMLYDDVKLKGTSCYYPIEIEQKIINMVNNGEKEELIILLNSVMEENTIKRDLGTIAYSNLKIALWATLNRTFDVVFKDASTASKNIKLMVGEETDELNISSFFELIIKEFVTICDIVILKCNKKNERLKKEIITYINENYSDYEMTHSHVALHFKLSESYFSRIFKEMYLVTFSTYVENIRIKKSIELMKNSNMKISDISAAVGYGDAQVFRRAFKRVMGTTPANYKDNVKD